MPLLDRKTLKEVLPVAGVLDPDMLFILRVTYGKAEEEEVI